MTSRSSESTPSASLRTEQLIAASSIGEGLREIEELGIDHHLLHLEQEMAKSWKRKPCPECGRS